MVRYAAPNRDGDGMSDARIAKPLEALNLRLQGNESIRSLYDSLDLPYLDSSITITLQVNGNIWQNLLLALRKRC